MRRSVALIILLLTNFTLFGQTFDTEFSPRGGSDEDVGAWVGGYDSGWGAENYGNSANIAGWSGDESVFAYPTWSAPDPFRDFSRYRLGAVRYRERGLDNRMFKVYLGGIELTDNLSSYPDYQLITLARRSGLGATQIPAMVADAYPAGIGRAESYSFEAAGDELYLLLRASDRYSRAGGDIRYSHSGNGGWSHTIAVTEQYGEDGHIRGVRSDEVGGTVSLTKKWTGGTSLTFFAAGGLSERGSRTSATMEAFALTGDNLYNPNWGWQNGKVRNSRQTGVKYFLGAAALETPLGKQRTLSLTLAYRDSRNSRSRLAWYDAHSPMPDYYRSMPSFFPDWSAAETIADAWREGDHSVTQVDWNDLYYNNALSADGLATYIVEDQVEHARDAHMNLSVNRRVSGTLDISYGVRLRQDNSRYFKVAGDMLGAEWVRNVDQYITDDDGEYHTKPPNDNDLRDPGRQVRLGERFGYDYSVTRLKPTAFGIVRWNNTHYGLTASASVTHIRLQREGFYEKELFPGTASFGKSPAEAFTTYSIGTAAYLNVSARHGFSLSVIAQTEAPFASDVFLSPQQNNLTAAGSVPTEIYGAEASWVYTGESVDVRIGGFVNSTVNGSDVRQYYDDLSSTFSDMVVRGIDRLGYGVEAGITARFTRWLTLSAGGSVGRYRYNSEPVASIFSDASGELISEGVVCYMSGLHTGLPERVAAAELAYYDRKYLRISLSGEWLGGRYVEINPLYHSSRITGINPAPEIMDRFTSQERLPDAFTLGFSVSKGFVLRHGYLRIAGSVRNLLSSSIIHSGYEHMRIRRLGSGLDRTMVPFPSKYMYAYPMTWSLTLSYRL